MTKSGVPWLTKPMTKFDILTDTDMTGAQDWLAPTANPTAHRIAEAAVQEADGEWGPNALTAKAAELARQTLGR